MKSCIYQCEIRHERLLPANHTFSYPLYLYCLDLSELPLIDRRLSLFGYNRWRLSSIHDSDYLHDKPGSIGQKLLHILKSNGYSGHVQKIMLLTSARFLGKVFNPVNFYYCLEENERLLYIVAEVNNTFGERHLYILKAEQNSPAGRPQTFSALKSFHVSPFNNMEGEYQFRFSELGPKLDIRIRLARNGETILKTRMDGDRIPLSPLNHMKTIIRHPFQPLLTVERILWEAARLYFIKKMPYHSKPVPHDPMTIQRTPSNAVQKICMKSVFRRLRKFKVGHLNVTLPNQKRVDFGDRESSLSAHLSIHDYNLFPKLAFSGDIGLGEGYTEGLWSSDDMASVLRIMVRNLNTEGVKKTSLPGLLNVLRKRLSRSEKNTVSASRSNIRRHYNLSNHFFETFLDPSMTYSCAMYHSEEDSLENAQKNKLHTIIKKAKITSSDHILEIGCGWGSFAVEAVRKTGCKVTAITLSRKQFDYVYSLVQESGLKNQISLVLTDYRKITGTYDKIVSIEMLEAVGHGYLGQFFSKCDRLLKPAGIMVLQVITVPDQKYFFYRNRMDWIQKHIFPGGHLPSLTALCQAMTNSSSFIIESLENIGTHYAATLREWHNRFQKNRDKVSAQGFDDIFQRKWEFYLKACEAQFAEKGLNDLQLVITRPFQ
jgi:cyclopropane-fatty-acyl-phospholipid synthase